MKLLDTLTKITAQSSGREIAKHTKDKLKDKAKPKDGKYKLKMLNAIWTFSTEARRNRFITEVKKQPGKDTEFEIL
jgi:hypothetical protein